MPVSAPADKRFRRAHVPPKKKGLLQRVGWARAVVLTGAMALIVLGAWQAATYALSSDALHVTQVRVEGTSRMSHGSVLAVVDGMRGQSMLAVDLDQWRAELLRAVWVADAALRRELPGTVVVAIRERQPLAIGRIGDELYLVDERGVIDEFGPTYADLDLPIVDGLSTEHAQGPDSFSVNEVRAALAIRFMTALQGKPELASRVSQIDVSDPEDVVVILKQDTSRVRLGNERFAERLQSYLELSGTLADRVPGLDVVDLRFDDRIYASGQGGHAARRLKGKGE